MYTYYSFIKSSEVNCAIAMREYCCPGTFKNNTPQLQNIERMSLSLVLHQSMVIISMIWIVICIFLFLWRMCSYVVYLTFFSLSTFVSYISVEFVSHSHNQFNNEVNPNTDYSGSVQCWQLVLLKWSQNRRA